MSPYICDANRLDRAVEELKELAKSYSVTVKAEIDAIDQRIYQAIALELLAAEQGKGSVDE